MQHFTSGLRQPLPPPPEADRDDYLHERPERLNPSVSGSADEAAAVPLAKLRANAPAGSQEPRASPLRTAHLAM